MRGWRRLGAADLLRLEREEVERLREDLDNCRVSLASEREWKRIHLADRDRYVRLFNRLDAAISHHKAAERFPDDHDEALWAARDRILRSAATPDESGSRVSA